MDKEIFIARLNKASEAALELAREFTFNNFAENIIYKIKPNSLDLNVYLTDLEQDNLIRRKKELNKTLTTDEVAERLLIENKVPVWINCAVVRSTDRITTIELTTSRRFRDDSELHHQEENSPPFHTFIQPPPYGSMDSKEKFDINWKNRKIQTTIKLRQFKRKNARWKSALNKKDLIFMNFYN